MRRIQTMLVAASALGAIAVPGTAAAADPPADSTTWSTQNVCPEHAVCRYSGTFGHGSFYRPTFDLPRDCTPVQVDPDPVLSVVNTNRFQVRLLQRNGGHVDLDAAPYPRSRIGDLRTTRRFVSVARHDCNGPA